VPELVDALAEVGFHRAQVWVAEADSDSGSLGDTYELQEPGRNLDSFNAYVVARRPHAPEVDGPAEADNGAGDDPDDARTT
jgi:hypothetical protein